MQENLRLIRKLLHSQTTLVLATVDEQARPRSTPLFFLTDNHLQLYWFSARASLHSRNLAACPSASVAVFRNTRRWQQIRGVQMDGVVAVVTDRRRRREWTLAYKARFALHASFAGVIARSALYCFTPEWVRYIENSRGFGHQFERKLTG